MNPLEQSGMAMIDMEQNPLRLALNKIADDAAQVKFYDELKDFEWLWGQVESKPEPVTQPWIVVATDHVLQGNRSLESWTSVDAWCLALAAAHGKDMPCVYLLDLRTDDPPLRNLDEDKEQAWWPQLHRFAPEPSAEGGIPFLDKFVAAVCAHQAATGAGSHTLATPSRTKRFDKIRECAELMDSNDRHDASNELGAMIMRAGLTLGDKPTDSGRNLAARILVETLLGQSKRDEVSLLIPSSIESGKVLSHFFPKSPKIILVDDRHDKGYGEVLSKFLGHEVIGFKGIFDQDVEDGSDETEPLKVLGADLEGLGKNDALNTFDADMLFLDLRLWRTTKNQKIAQNKYDALFRKLGFTDQIGPIQADESSHRRLALIPKMLASIDPSLPIILFSSTQHRSVTQAVRDVPNIITDFAKPYIGGNDPDEYDPATVLEGLRFAVERAAKMVEIRVVWRQACQEWNKKNLTELNWGRADGWPRLKIKESPLSWLRQIWLPLMQREEYALAAAAPWIWLRKTLGETRTAILLKQHGTDSRKQTQYLKVLRRCQNLPLLEIGSNSAARELAIVAGLSLVKLVGMWADT